jgi:N-acetylmuramic acid 6-phosphate etherase
MVRNPKLAELATEAANPRSARLDELPLRRLLEIINEEDRTVPRAVGRAMPAIEEAVVGVAGCLRQGGRLFYIGAGTSGRLGCLDASEMPPTFGVEPEMVQGIIAGGPPALTASQEGAEDDGPAGRHDLARRHVGPLDAVAGLSASGRARYVQEALREAARRGAFTICVTCNPNSPLASLARVPIVAETGPEVLAGSTRMKAGTAQKLILNMITTGAMVLLGRVRGNKMVNLQLKCEKLRERARNMVMEASEVDEAQAEEALALAGGSVLYAIESLAQLQDKGK